ncbi:MAG: cation transporter, partial [Peptostreptococcaceae bacterium]
MLILDLNLNKVISSFEKNIYNKNNYYFILCTPQELKNVKEPLDIDEITFEECLEFDNSMKLDLFERYDFISLNTFKFINEKLIIE